MPSLPEFFTMLGSNPLLALTMFLVAATIFVNGSTDAANSIADAVGTRSITFENAVILAVAAGLVFLAYIAAGGVIGLLLAAGDEILEL